MTAQHTVAMTLLAIALIMALVFQSARPTANLWPALVALVPAMVLLAVGERSNALVWSVAYLLVGAVGIHVYALTMLSQPIPVHVSDGFTFLAVKAALIMVGGVVVRVSVAIIGAIVGYLIAELAIGFALLATGNSLYFDGASFLTLVVTVTIIPLIGLGSRRQQRALPRLQRAAQAERVAALRYRIEASAATLMHDTVLNHLAAIADSESDHLDPLLRRQIRQDVDALTSEEWLAETAEVSDRQTKVDWQHSGLFAALQEGRLLGLNITTSGDLTAVGRLDRETSAALGLAVKQCLVNVLKHSGVRHAEVAIYRTDRTVSVMVIDNGRGFVESATGADRLGLRASVRKRIDLIGGQVDVWSTPGRGTSIMIKVPAAGPTASGAQ